MVCEMTISTPSMKHLVDISLLCGNLAKESQKPKLLGSNKLTRYFCVEEISGGSGCELALCYYKHKVDKEAAGWFFLKDVSEIEEETAIKGSSHGLFIINHPARSFR